MHTELPAVSSTATILWHNGVPIPVTEVDKRTQIHTTVCTHTHARARLHTHVFVGMFMLQWLATKLNGDNGLLQLEHLIQCPTKFLFPWPSRAHVFASNPNPFHSTRLQVHLALFFSDTAFDLLCFSEMWVVCVFETGSVRGVKILGFNRAKEAA